MLNGIGEIESYLRPSDIDRELQEIITICEDTPELQAEFRVEEGADGEPFTYFVLEKARDEKDITEEPKTVVVFDGLHTNEPMGGTTMVKLLHAMSTDPQIFDDLDSDRLVYYHKNPAGMERNGDELIHGKLSIGGYLKAAHRGPDKEWGYSKDGGKYPENDNGMWLLKTYKPQVLVALHNMGADGAKVHVTGFEKERAHALSAYLAEHYVIAQPEPGMEDVTKIAEGVYDTLSCVYRPEGYMDSRSWYAEQQEEARTVAPEVPLFARKEGVASGIPSEAMLDEIMQQAKAIDDLVEEAMQKWGNNLNIPNDAQDIFASVSEYYYPLEDSLEGMKQIEGEVDEAEMRMRLHFYPGFMLGHARRAVMELQNAGLKDSAVQNYIDEAEKLIDAVTPGLEKYYKPTSRSQQTKPYLGSIAITLMSRLHFT